MHPRAVYYFENSDIRVIQNNLKKDLIATKSGCSITLWLYTKNYQQGLIHISDNKDK